MDFEIECEFCLASWYLYLNFSLFI